MRAKAIQCNLVVVVKILEDADNLAHGLNIDVGAVNDLMQALAILVVGVTKVNPEYQVQLGAIDNVGNETIPNDLAPLIDLNDPHHKPVLVHTLRLRLVVGGEDVDDG